jgi:hypothetical protein
MTDPSGRLRALLDRLETDGVIPASGNELDDGLESLEDSALIARVRDCGIPTGDRLRALRAFAERHRTDLTASDLLLELVDGDEPALAAEALELSLPFDSRFRHRLLELLDDPRPERATAAAEALGRRKERSILPRMLEWALRHEPPRRHAGLRAVCWIVSPDERAGFLTRLWDTESAWTTVEDRLELASLMAGLNNLRCTDFLLELSQSESRHAAQARLLLNRLRKPEVPANPGNL